MLPSDRVEVNAQLFVDSELDDHVVQEAAVDVVVQVLDRHFDLGRIANVIFVNLKQKRKHQSRFRIDLNIEVKVNQNSGLQITLLLSHWHK